MENASKALLIAASVLIVILIIAVGVKITSSSDGIKKTASDTGETINQGTEDAASLAIGKIGDKTPLSESGLKEEDYVGCYADVDNNGTVDGIIYADTGVGNLKNYYVSKTMYNGKFGDNYKITSSDKNGSRFKVMMLTDYGEYTWDQAKEMQINEKEKVWNVPEKNEWETFADALSIDYSNYLDKGFKNKMYWSTNEEKGYGVRMYFDSRYKPKEDGTMSNGIGVASKDRKCPVRLITTF